MFREMKVGTKIFNGFLLVTAIVVLVGVVGYMGMGCIMANLDEITGNRLPRIKSLLIMNEAQQSVLVGERGLLVRRMQNPQVRSAQYAYIGRAWKRAEDAWKVYESLPRTREETQLWEAFVPQWEQWKKEHQRVVELSIKKDRLIFAGDSLSNQRVTTIDEDALDASLAARKSFIVATKSLSMIIEQNERLAQEVKNKATVTEGNAKLMLVGVILIALGSPFLRTWHRHRQDDQQTD